MSDYYGEIYRLLIYTYIADFQNQIRKRHLILYSYVNYAIKICSARDKIEKGRKKHYK